VLQVKTTIVGYPGGQGLVAHYFAGPGAGTLAEATEALGRVRAFWDALKAKVHSSMTYQPQQVVSEMNPATGDITAQFTTAGVVFVSGTGAGDKMPGAASYVAQYLTGVFLNGRQVRGRTFVGVALEGDNDAQGHPSTGTGTISAAGTKLALQIITPLTHVVWHRPGPHGAGSAVSVLGNGYSCNSEWGFMRGHGVAGH